MTTIRTVACLLLFSASTLRAGDPTGTAFTYQGQLKQDGLPADGSFDFQFTLLEPDGVTIVARTCQFNVAVVDGLFQAQVNFGLAPFNGTPRLLRLGVRPAAGGINDCTPNTIGFLFELLSPLRPVSPVPYALHALQAPAGHSLNAADGDPANALFVDASGNVGVGTTVATNRLHVSNGSSGGTSQGGSELLVEDNAACYVNIMAPDASERGISFGSPADSVHGGMYYTNAGGLNLRTNGNVARMAIDASGNVGVGTAGHSIDARLHVESAGTRAAKFDRFTSDGEIVAFARDDGVIGNITNSGGTVTYNAFTGSHYAWSAAEIPSGTLVSLTGENRRYADRKDAEVVYGIALTARANDPACLGVHLGPMESTRALGPDNPRLVAAVGNGEMHVVDVGGGDVEPGDYLISSDIHGCAMKDDPARFPIGHVVARAAERVIWSRVSPDGQGMRTARISVLFGNFVRGSIDSDRQLKLELQKRDADNAAIRSRLAELESLLMRMRMAQTEPRP